MSEKVPRNALKDRFVVHQKREFLMDISAKSCLDGNLSWQLVVAWENGRKTPNLDKLSKTSLVVPFIGRIELVQFFNSRVRDQSGLAP